MTRVLVPGDLAFARDRGMVEVMREADPPPEAPVVVRPMTEEERRKYGPPKRPTRAELEECVAAKMDPAAIGRKYGVSEARIRRLLRLRGKFPPRRAEEGVQPVLKGSDEPRKPELTREALAAAIAQGKKNRELADMFGVTGWRLYVRQKEWGLLRSRRRVETEGSAVDDVKHAEGTTVNVLGLHLSEKGDTTQVCRVLAAAKAMIEALGGEFEVSVTVRRSVAS